MGITLSMLRDYWKNVSDWATGVSVTAPKVGIDQSNPGTTNKVVAELSREGE